MKQLKTMCLAVVIGLGTMGAAQAATPEEKCNKAVGKNADTFFKEVGKTVKAICAGKDVGDVKTKAAAKLTKAIDKLAKVDTDNDCDTVTMDASDAFPIEAADYDAAASGYEFLVEGADAQCGLDVDAAIDLTP